MKPIAARLRPQSLDGFYGQSHLLDPGKPLRLAIEQQRCHSMILWGPPGTGKTTLAQILAQSANMTYQAISAVLAGVKDIRQVVDQAKAANQPTLLFIDEIHRFNKAQQDALLPFVEEGLLTLIGATTENPSFECNRALLSRCQVYVLNALNEEELGAILDRALTTDAGLKELNPSFEGKAKSMVIELAGGDARRLLNILDVITERFASNEKSLVITEALVQKSQSLKSAHFDKQGENFYDQISALHKSVRGSSADGALYWLNRMLLGGVDPAYLSRRIIRMASEDIGNADPRALTLCLDAAHAMERLGSPEGELALAQAVVYLACAPKSNAVYTAQKQAMECANRTSHLPVPLHLRNAPTKLMKQLDYGADYAYDHDYPDGVAFAQRYFPEKMSEQQFYHPVNRGLEIKIGEKTAWLNQQRQQARKQKENA